MGHFYHVSFKAQLTEIGAQIIGHLYESRDWRATAEFFAEYRCVEEFERKGPPIPFADGHHRFDPETRIWEVRVTFKDRRGDAPSILDDFLACIVREPTDVRVDHDLFDTPSKMLVQPRSTPMKPDWDRCYGD